MQERYSTKSATTDLGIQKQGETIRLQIIPNNPKEESREIELPKKLIDTHIEEYLSAHSDRTPSEDLIKEAFKYSVNQALKSTDIHRPMLQRAAEAGDEELVKELLLKQDIDVSEQAEGCWTALLYAAAQGYPRIMRLLLDAGADPDMENLLRITPLIYGARYGNLDVCKILLKYGANTDLRDVDGRTALMIAASLGHVNVVKILLKAGANIAIKDRYSMTALSIAQNRKQGKIAKMLRVAKSGK